MVLCWRRHGRAGGCQIKKKINFFLKDFISDPKYKTESLVFEMTDNISQTCTLKNCIQTQLLKLIDI